MEQNEHNMLGDILACGLIGLPVSWLLRVLELGLLDHPLVTALIGLACAAAITLARRKVEQLNGLAQQGFRRRSALRLAIHGAAMHRGMSLRRARRIRVLTTCLISTAVAFYSSRSVGGVVLWPLLLTVSGITLHKLDRWVDGLHQP